MVGVSLRANEVNAIEWKAGDFAISQRRRPPIFFFRVVRVDRDDDGEPLLVSWWWCCSHCEELERFGGAWIASFFRPATREEIRALSGRDFCPFRSLPRVRPRVGACMRRLRFELL